MNVFKIISGTWRQCGNPKQLKKYRCFTEDDIKKFIDENNGERMCAISICAYRGDEKILLYVPFDFDDKDRSLAFYDAVKLTDYCRIMGWQFIMVDTTHKGYHVWIPCREKTYEKDVLRNFQIYLKDKLDLKTVDEQLFGDVRRLLRIPMTYHEKTHRLCGYVRMEDRGVLPDLNDFMKTERCYYSNYNKNIEINTGEDTNAWKMQEQIKPSKLSDKLRKSIVPAKSIKPCLEKYIRVENPTAWIRAMMTAHLYRRGWDKEKIFNFYKSLNWIDWNETVTNYHLNFITTSGKNGCYEEPSCETIIKHGYCLGGECEYYNKN